MSTPAQSDYINDLAVIKTKEFKEVKELLTSNNIVSSDSQTVVTAGSIAQVCNALTDFQASRLIDALTASKTPVRATAYAPARVTKTIDALDSIKTTIGSWDFN